MQPVQTIEKLAHATFRCSWEKVKNSTLKLNFDVLIAHYGLTGSFCLLHWQARPKGLRQWGVYCSSTDSYYSVKYNRMAFEAGQQMEALQIDETVEHTVPTAVLHLMNTYVQPKGDLIFIKRVISE
jgi:hypothetical protein